MTENPHTLKPLWSFLTLSQYYRYHRITYIIHSSSSSPKPGLKTNPFICDLEKYKDDLNSSTEWGISFGTFIIIIRQFSFLKIEFLTKSLLCLCLVWIMKHSRYLRKCYSIWFKNRRETTVGNPQECFLQYKYLLKMEAVTPPHRRSQQDREQFCGGKQGSTMSRW